MRYIIICEIIALFILPVRMAILHRRGVNFEKPMAFALATLLGLIMGTYWLYLQNPETLFSLTLKDWLSALAFALLCWLFIYPLTRWINRQLFRPK
jgi:hypothetical protein